MPYLFVDDGYPEASEYSNNYVWYDDKDPGALERAMAEAEQRKTGRVPWQPAAAGVSAGR